MKNKIPFAFSLVASAMLGTMVEALLEEPPASSAITSVRAEIGPSDKQHDKHAAHHHDDTERLNVSGRGAIVLPAIVVHGSGTVHEKLGHAPHDHTPEEEHGSPDVTVALTGQAASFEQGSMGPGTSTAL